MRQKQAAGMAVGEFQCLFQVDLYFVFDRKRPPNLFNSRENSRQKCTFGRAISTLFSSILERIGCCCVTNGIRAPSIPPRKGEEKKDVIIANNHHFNNFPPPSGELEGAPLRDSLVTTFDNL